MSFDDTLLMAYVDGELPPSRRAEIEQAIAGSPELAHRVALLRASVLPYQAAYARRPVPPVPASLAAFVTELALTGVAPARPARAGDTFEAPIAVDGFDQSDFEQSGLDHRAGARDEADAPLAVASQAPDPAHDAPRGGTGDVPSAGRPTAAVASLAAAREARDTREARRPRRSGLWLAAAFIAGAFICGAALKGGHLLEPRVAPWLEAAAGYQELYTRETVADVPDSASIDARLIDEVRQDDHLPIAIPDLRQAGLTFKRIQRLRFRGRPLIQIVYLPERGDPVALCVIDAKQDQPMKSQHVYGMDVVSWSQDKLAFALIGHNDVVDLAALHRQLADNPSLIRVD